MGTTMHKDIASAYYNSMSNIVSVACDAIRANDKHTYMFDYLKKVNLPTIEVFDFATSTYHTHKVYGIVLDDPTYDGITASFIINGNKKIFFELAEFNSCIGVWLEVVNHERKRQLVSKFINACGLVIETAKSVLMNNNLSFCFDYLNDNDYYYDERPDAIICENGELKRNGVITNLKLSNNNSVVLVNEFGVETNISQLPLWAFMPSLIESIYPSYAFD